MKTCPFCAEEIQDAAIVCKHCGRELGATPPPVPSAAPTVAAPAAASVWTKPRSSRQGLALLAVVIGFVLTLVSSASAGFGVLMLWGGLAFAMTGSATKRWGGGFIVAIILGTIGMSMGGTMSSSTSTAVTPTSASSTPSTPASRPAPPAPAGPKLALIAARGYEAEFGGYHYIEGQVKNISDESIQNVTAVAIWTDKEGNFIKSDDALIDYNPILPGQTSPFKTISTGNPAMARYRVEFKTLFGGTLAVEDQRKQ